MRVLNEQEIILFHEKVIKASGGGCGLKESKLLNSVLGRMEVTFGGEDLYPTDIQKIAAGTHSLVLGHPFVDGNKRIGVCAMLLLLHINNVKIEYTQQELIELGLKMAEGKMDVESIVEWIERHLVKK